MSVNISCMKTLKLIACFCVCFFSLLTTSQDIVHKPANTVHSLSSSSTSSISPLSHDSSLLNNQNDLNQSYNANLIKTRLAQDLNTKPRPFIKRMSVTDVRSTVTKESLVTFEQANDNEVSHRKVRDQSPCTFRAIPLSVSDNLRVSLNYFFIN